MTTTSRIPPLYACALSPIQRACLSAYLAWTESPCPAPDEIAEIFVDLHRMLSLPTRAERVDFLLREQWCDDRASASLLLQLIDNELADASLTLNAATLADLTERLATIRTLPSIITTTFLDLRVHDDATYLLVRLPHRALPIAIALDDAQLRLLRHALPCAS